MSPTHELIRQRLEVERIESELKDAKSRYDELNRIVSDEFQATDTQSQKVTVDGKTFTVFRRREFYCNVPAANREKVVTVCRNLGMDDLVETVVQTTKLKAWLREQVETDDDPAGSYDWDSVPEELKGLLSVGESVKAVVQRK